MQHYVMNNLSYTSQQRQQRILNDINSIIMLISAYKKSLKTTNNKTKLQSFGQKTFQLKNLKQSQILLSQKDKQYAQYGIKFQQISYNQLLYLLCRKQILNEFIQSFIEEKYQTKNLSSFHQKLADNLKQVYNKNQPQISLSACVNQNWIDIFSKQDIFDDTLDLFKSSISKNWRVNQIKTDKKLHNSLLLNQGSKIFQTEPNLDDIKVNPAKLVQQTKSKQVIQESTRQILKGLQKLRREMQQCQAQMNMAKNNDNKILQKNQQYSCKKKQYNELKQIYRKRTTNKEQNKIRKNQKDNKQSSILINNQSGLKDNLSQHGLNINVSKNLEVTLQVKKQVQGGKQLPNKSEQQSDKVQQKTKEKQKQKQIKQQENSQQPQILNKSIILESKKQYLTSQDYDELIQILDIFNKNQQKNQRIQILATVQTQNIKTPVKQITNVKNLDKNQRENLINSSKQQFLDKYVRKVFNHYILEQSKMKHLSLFDKNLSGSQLNFSQTLAQSQKRKGNTQLLSPSLRKKFSVQIQQSINKDSGKRRMSLINQTIKQTNYPKTNKLRQRIKTIGASVSQYHSFAFKQPQLSIQSFSKFAKAFQLSNKSVSLTQILNLFKKKSHNKKSVTFNQFLQLFQLIYRLECQKMKIEFTSLMFDNYLKKEIFSWDKINKVLRLKTLGLESSNTKGKTPSQLNNTNNSNQNRYKFSLVGHSGRLSEEIMQKINSSKKPIDKMPCMNRNKTSPFGYEDDLPKTRIQIKVQQMKRLKQLQKAKQKQQLQTYLAESRMRENQLYQLYQDFKNQSNKSYSKRYRLMENKKRQTNDVINNFPKNNNKLINLKKLQFNSRYVQNQSQASNTNKKYNNKNYYIQSQASNKKRARTLQSSYQTIQSQNYIKQMKKKQKFQSQKEIIQLEKIIGIRQSDQQSQYSQEFQEDYDPKVNQKNSRIGSNSLLYQTIINSQKFDDLDQIRKNNKKQVQPLQNNYKKTSIKSKNRQQDEYLANYFSKQESHISPIRYFSSGTQSLQNQDTQSLTNGRQNWRVHF